jgi:hypothetical protein
VIGFLALSTAVTIVSWLVAARRSEHRPVALFLTLSLGADLGRWGLTALVLIPERVRSGGAPFTGWYRVACDIDPALFLAGQAGLAALAMWVFLRRRPWPVAVAWAVAVAALVVTYPTTRGAVLQRCYLAAELATVAVVAGCYVMWWWRREKPSFSNVCTLLLGSGQVAILIGPYSRNIFTSWDIAQAMYATIYVVLFLLHGGILWRLEQPFKSH